MGKIPEKYQFDQIEKKLMQRWLEEKIYHWDQTRGREETFVVDTPPPTVSGSLHVGSAFGYIQQDVIVRQRRMRGFNIFYPMGWDDNGLPTERRVQNFYNVRCNTHLPYQPGFKPKNDKKSHPEEINRDNFIELCHNVTGEDEKVFKQLWQHLGLSIDWQLEYATIDDLCRRTSQLSFAKLFKDGHVYSMFAPHLWDVDFQTAVSQAEVEDRNMPGFFHNIRFGVEGDSTGSSQAASFVIATTRPELLASCVAVIAHPEDERYKALFGKKAVTPLFRVPVPIIANDKADPEKGTGILMVCTFGDVMDVEWWRQYKLPLRQTIGRNGRMMPVQFGPQGWESLNAGQANEFYGQLSGKNIKQAQAAVVELLRNADTEALSGLGAPLQGDPRPIEHPVKMYEKGERPLEIIPTRQWYIRIMDKKEALIEQGNKIKWHPDFMKVRYENWVQGLNQDWCVSRQRYFGVPFPVWYKLDPEGNPDHENPILADEKMLPTDPQSHPAPGFDESQRDKPNGFTGDPDVMDTWATSSMTPQIASHWALGDGRHQKVFPMDIRPQGPEIIRTWAFYTIVKAYLHENRIPWHNVLVNGWILDPDRKKMSKSHGQAITPEHLLQQYSSDGVRYWSAKARLGVDTAYDEALFANGKRLVTKLYNASKFVAGHLLNQDLSSLTTDKVIEELDRSFLDHLLQVVTKTGKHFDNFEYADALQYTESFFWEKFCDNYLELVKVRAYQEEMTPGKISALATLKFTLSVLLRLFAPFIPFFTEEAWGWIFASDQGRDRSIHTSAWPEEKEFSGVAKPGVNDAFGAAMEVLSAVRKTKSEAKVSVKTPLKGLSISGNEEDIKVIKLIWNDLLQTAGAREAETSFAKPAAGRFEIKAEL
ncbi:MAG: valine--tRNA ligase [Candidatus Edwardsbacteria bacterium]|nr:valine--tRNA ligase [Candidatus Edwardsbacteria bacterium]